jgi:hypothetical protein
MKKVIFQMAMLFAVVSMVSCSSNKKSVEESNSTEISKVSEELGNLMKERVEMYRNGELELTEADQPTIDKVTAYLAQTKGESMNNLKGCPWYKDIECSAALAAAVIACGGPEDIPCIVAALGAMSSCIDCL